MAQRGTTLKGRTTGVWNSGAEIATLRQVEAPHDERTVVRGFSLVRCRAGTTLKGRTTGSCLCEDCSDEAIWVGH